MQYYLEQKDKIDVLKAEREEEAKVFATNPNMWMDLYAGGAPADPVDDSGVYFPVDEEGLEAMAKEWEEAGWDSGR